MAFTNTLRRALFGASLAALPSHAALVSFSLNRVRIPVRTQGFELGQTAEGLLTCHFETPAPPSPLRTPAFHNVKIPVKVTQRILGSYDVEIAGGQYRSNVNADTKGCAVLLVFGGKTMPLAGVPAEELRPSTIVLAGSTADMSPDDLRDFLGANLTSELSRRFTGTQPLELRPSSGGSIIVIP